MGSRQNRAPLVTWGCCCGADVSSWGGVWGEQGVCRCSLLVGEPQRGEQAEHPKGSHAEGGGWHPAGERSLESRSRAQEGWDVLISWDSVGKAQAGG